ncbi:DUF3048 domain-containing protein [Xylanibacillus composti]|uniref:Putative lipoprotein YerB n=1 Tax=Xylanibacillus composti TaxID=1572762 RepID=A0A8J4H7R5_9BACL|nr:DUF3048 domain-containing protein [Xylanibacillus composti]MDT9727218.1 DUF3048 domain-containing protein [Xylanibacillus composti]GIQ71311.1 putative lipoprotein YerB [Xylanibacillus composti]
MKREWRLAVLLGIVAIILLAGCGNKQADQELEEEPPVAMPAEEPEEPIVYPFSYPLTGIGTEEEHYKRPIMVMVENQAQARPQSGLHRADQVYEVLAEGDITRFLAVYQSDDPDVIGPVRSIRPYFVELGAGLDALIVHAGWSQEAMNIIARRKLAHFDQVYGDHAYYWRSSERRAPHNLYTSVELIRKGAEDKGYREDWNDPAFRFVDTIEAAAIEPGSEAHDISIPYYSSYHVSYHWNEEIGRYERHMLGEPHKDKETEEQLVADNILIIEASHRVVDDVGRRHVDVFGPGNGHLVQKGKIREVTWENRGGIIRALVQGEEVPLLPGKTWVQIVPVGTKLEVQGEGGSASTELEE